MKIDVYQEQYKSKQAYAEPGKIGFGFDVEKAGALAGNIIDVTLKKHENDDALNSARIEADTMLAADKMYRNFEETADPENFEQDMANQKSAIQELIKTQSKQFKLTKSQTAFSEKMTRGLEERYMAKTLAYSYGLQEETYKTKFMQNYDNLDANLLAGNTMLTLDDVINLKTEAARTMAQRYHIPADKLDAFVKQQVSKSVSSYAYAMIDKDPQQVMDVMVGNGIEQFRAAKEAVGQNFTMEEFLGNPELQREYAESDFGAKFTNYMQYLDYNTRKDIYEKAQYQLDKITKDKQQEKLAADCMASEDLETWKKAELDNIEQYGSTTPKFGGAHTIDYNIDPRLGDVGQPISMGSISEGTLSPGNSYTEANRNFAKGVAGGLSGKSFKVKMTSGMRPGDTDSKHKDGGATDLVFTKNGQLSVLGTIEGYASAISRYGNHIPKKGVLLEIKNSDLSDAERNQLRKLDGTEMDVVDYIKSQMISRGIDISWIDFEDSKKYRDKATGGHVHFTMDKSADYTKTAAGGAGTKYNLRSDYGYEVYKLHMSKGESPKDCYAAAKKAETEIFASLKGAQMVRDMALVTDSSGKVIGYRDPAEFQKAIEQKRNAIMNNKSLSTDERYIQLEGLKYAQKKATDAMTLYQEDPVQMVKTVMPNVTSDEQAVNILAHGYGVDTRNLTTMTNARAQTLADELQNKMNPTEAVNYIKTRVKSPAELKQIAQYVKGDKGDMIIYSSLASPYMADNIAAAVQNLDTTQMMMKQDKTHFSSGWETNKINDFKKNPTVKKFLSDLDKTNPGESAKLLNAMTQVYAYERTQGAHKTAKDRDIINYITKGFIGDNYTSTSVSTPNGATVINISKGIPNAEGNAYKIMQVMTSASNRGINPNQIWAYEGTITDSHARIQAEYNKGAEADRKRQVNAIQRNSTVTSTPDGLAVQFIWENKLQGDKPILLKNTSKPVEISYVEAIKIFDEAEEIVNKYMKASGTTYNHPTASQYVQEADMTVPKSIAKGTAYGMAIDYVLSKHYNWIDNTSITDFSKIKTINKAKKGKFSKDIVY